MQDNMLGVMAAMVVLAVTVTCAFGCLAIGSFFGVAWGFVAGAAASLLVTVLLAIAYDAVRDNGC